MFGIQKFLQNILHKTVIYTVKFNRTTREVYVFTCITQQKIIKIPIILLLMHGDMFRLCLQPSSGQLVVQIRYNYCAYDMGYHKVYMSSITVKDIIKLFTYWLKW